MAGGIFGRMREWLFGRDLSQAQQSHAPEDWRPMQTGQRETVRRWDSAQTHRLNKARWASANNAQHINADLATSLKTLRARCVYEAFNNPWVEGVIRTHSIDVVTPSGPTLVVESSNENYNKRFKAAWEEWWSAPDIARELTGVDFMRRWNAVRWTKGPIFAQFANDPDVTSSDLVSLRIRDIDPDRLDTPPSLLAREDVAFGVQRDLKTGRPTKFYVEKTNQRSTNRYIAPKFDDIPAEDALFAFLSLEADQATGFPALASCLEEIGQLRDYDTEVLDAARQFANNAMALYTEQPEFLAKAGISLPTGTVETKRGTMKYIHPGYKPMALNSTQPAANYKEFRFEKLRSLGRPVSMPLLLILLSAEESNFSQSRIDVNVFYERGLACEREWYSSHVLNPIRRRFAQEMQLVQRRGQFVLPPAPLDLKFSWHWERMPQADEVKHLQAQILRRQLGTSTWSHDLAEAGIDRDAMKSTIARDQVDLESIGINPLAGDASVVADIVAANDASNNATQTAEAT